MLLAMTRLYFLNSGLSNLLLDAKASTTKHWLGFCLFAGGGGWFVEFFRGHLLCRYVRAALYAISEFAKSYSIEIPSQGVLVSNLMLM